MATRVPGEIVNKLSRAVLLFGLLCWSLTLALPFASAQTRPRLKTRNVVLIFSDGLRWQEIFTGADSALMNSEHGGIWADAKELKQAFWRDDVSERRELLFPFLWSVVAKKGQIFGNQTKGSVANVTNGMAFSYPGYNEMLTGHPDPNRSQRIWPESQCHRFGIAQPHAGIPWQGCGIRNLECVPGHLQRKTQPLNHANRMELT
jgi:hypothetical protein